MLRREDWMMIKQMKDKGCYLQEIAAEAGVSEKTISRALKRGGAPAKRKAGVRASKLGGDFEPHSGVGLRGPGEYFARLYSPEAGAAPASSDGAF